MIVRTGERVGPLSGRRILEVGHMLAGPYCGMVLADLGAEVIKIESGEGDISRHTGRHYVGPHNVYFASLNRGKKSVQLDLTTGAGRSDFELLVKSADALLTNLRPEAIEKLGLDYRTLGPLNPKLVCVSLTGFGMSGPHRNRPAYDYIIQALCGVMMLTGEPGSAPSRAGYSVVDNSAGLTAAVALLAKLVSGSGGQVDVSLYDVMLSQLNYLAAAYLTAGDCPSRLPHGGHSFFVPAQIFATSNGYLALFITHDRFWGEFCRLVGREDWLLDRRFASVTARSANRESLLPQLEAMFLAASTAHWLERLENRGLVIAAIHTLPEALESSLAGHMIITVETPSGPLRLVGSPIRVDGSVPQYAEPPTLGRDTEAILEVLRGQAPASGGRQG